MDEDDTKNPTSEIVKAPFNLMLSDVASLNNIATLRGKPPASEVVRGAIITERMLREAAERGRIFLEGDKQYEIKYPDRQSGSANGEQNGSGRQLANDAGNHDMEVSFNLPQSEIDALRHIARLRGGVSDTQALRGAIATEEIVMLGLAHGERLVLQDQDGVRIPVTFSDRDSSHDGTGAGDHNEPYSPPKRFPTTDAPLPFTSAQYKDLLKLKATDKVTERRIEERKAQEEGGPSR